MKAPRIYDKQERKFIKVYAMFWGEKGELLYIESTEYHNTYDPKRFLIEPTCGECKDFDTARCSTYFYPHKKSDLVCTNKFEPKEVK